MDSHDNSVTQGALSEDSGDHTRCPSVLSDLFPTRGEGNLHARIMLIGTAPGAEEGRTGKLWAGRAGQILDELLTEANLTRQDIYLTNLLKCHLPNHRRPKMAEIESCRPLLEREIADINPRVIATLGYYPTKALFQWHNLGNPRRDEYRRLYGKPHPANNRLIIPLHNPAALIPAPELAEEVKRTFRKLAAAMNEWMLDADEKP